MNREFLDARYKMSQLLSQLENLVEKTPAKTFEDRIARNYLQAVIDQMDTAVCKIEHFSKPTVEGTLREMNNQKFELIDEQGRQVTYFNCADSIECFVEYDDELQWCAGRVEHTTRDGCTGYYFHHSGAGHPFLYTGMKARVRREG